jgi:hypothetical protein
LYEGCLPIETRDAKTGLKTAKSTVTKIPVLSMAKRKTNVETRSTTHHNLTQNGIHKTGSPEQNPTGENHSKPEGLKQGFCNTEAGFKQVNNTDQARVQFTS